MDKSIKKLVHLLKQIIDDAGYALICNASDDARLFCIRQYNNVYRRLSEIDTALAAPFSPLSEDVSLGAVRLSSRDMAWALIDYLKKQSRRSFWGCIAAPFWFSDEEWEGAWG